MGGGGCVTTQRKNEIKGKCRVGGGVCGKIYGIIYKGGKM